MLCDELMVSELLNFVCEFWGKKKKKIAKVCELLGDVMN